MKRRLFISTLPPPNGIHCGAFFDLLEYLNVLSSAYVTQPEAIKNIATTKKKLY